MFPMKVLNRLIYLISSLASISSASDQETSSKCVARAEFILENINYYSYLAYSTPAHLAVSEGFINFTLTKTADGSNAYCYGEGGTPFNFFNGDIIYHCSDFQTSSSSSSSSFKYSYPSNLFQVNATWICQEGRPIASM
jgi:Alternaria alternata allergen 1